MTTAARPTTTTPAAPVPKTDKRAELLAGLETTIEELAGALSADELTAKINAYGRLMARFHHYSLNNILLMEMQLRRRGRTLVQAAGFRAWIDLNRAPHKGTGLAILAPTSYKVKDEETGEEWRQLRGFRLVYVFDVADTYVLEGKEDKYQAAQLTWQRLAGDHEALYERLLACATRAGITVLQARDEDGAAVHGWSSGAGTIWINTYWGSGDRTKTLIHELAHELCHDRARRQGYAGGPEPGLRAQLECEAEAIAYVLGAELGLASVNSPQYLALHGVSPARLRRSLAAIKDGVSTVLDALEQPDGPGEGVKSEKEEMRETSRQ